MKLGFLSIFWGDAFALKKILCFLELWFLKLRFCKFQSLWTNIDPFVWIYNRWNSPFPGLGDLQKISLGGPFPGLETYIVSFFLVFFELYDAPLFQVSEPSAKYSSFFWGNYNFWRCASAGFGAFQKICGPSRKYDFWKCVFSRFWRFPRNIVPFSWNYNFWAALLHVSETSYFFLCFGTKIFETVFLARLGCSQNIVPFLPEL